MSAAAPAPENLYHPLGAARGVFLRRESEVLLSGPAGTGKSRACLEKLHLCALKYPTMRALIVRKTRESLTESGLVTFEEKVLPKGSAIAEGPQRRMRQAYHYPNGSEVVVGGLDKPGKVMSTEYDLVYVQEAVDLSENDWESLTTRLRNNVMPYQQIIADCNPDAPSHWLKKRADRGLTLLLESRHEDNPTVTEAYLAKLDALTGVRFLRLRRGVWAAAEGMVYDGWDRAVHLVDAAPATIKYHVAGIDWGFKNPGVIQVWGVDGDKRMTRVYEVYQTEHTVDGFWTPKALELRDRFKIQVFVADPSQPTHIQSMRNAGLPVAEAFNDIKPGVENVQERMKVQADGAPRLFFQRGALELRDEELAGAHKPTCSEEEIEAYVWPKAADGKPLKEVPVDDNNHGMDAMRYACAYVDDLGSARVKVSDSERQLAALLGGRRV